MSPLEVKNISSSSIEKIKNPQSLSRDPISDFKEVLNQSIDQLNHQLKQADQVTQEMILGEKDIHQSMIALEQANISLRLMIQIRNKILSAYEEIMRMQF